MANSKTISAVAAATAAGGGGRRGCKSPKKKALDLDELVPIPNSLSELEMDAIKLLVQLSGGSSSVEKSDFDFNNNGREGIDGKNRAPVAPPPHSHDDEVSSSSEYKLLFITDQSVEQDAEEEEDEDDIHDEEEILGRRKKKLRAISEVYEFTEPLIVNVVGVGGANNRKRKRTTSTSPSTSTTTTLEEA